MQEDELMIYQMQKEQFQKTCDEYEREFHAFLIQNKKDLDEDTVMQLLQSHGKINDCIKYANSMEQFARLIPYYINAGQYQEALKMLKKIPSAEERYYQMTKYMSTLIKKAPIQTIEVLESPGFRKIDLAKLMPALMDCPDDARLSARRFVEEHCIKQRRSQESSVHNMCFYLYAKSDDSTDLLTYLKKEEINHNANQAIHFDVTYALNVCK